VFALRGRSPDKETCDAELTDCSQDLPGLKISRIFEKIALKNKIRKTGRFHVPNASPHDIFFYKDGLHYFRILVS
jgi:hypothetical protein